MLLVFLLDLFFLNQVIIDAEFSAALQNVRRAANAFSEPVQCSLLTKLEEAEAKVRLEMLLCLAAAQITMSLPQNLAVAAGFLTCKSVVFAKMTEKSLMLDAGSLCKKSPLCSPHCVG